ncbi:hypothetical protein GS507_26220 [Rhodococcus hoagii]|nr:hypothetical protein [Prescottella equi]
MHSADVVWADGPGRGGASAPVADAAVSRDGSRPLAVMVADCLPVVVVDETTGATAVAPRRSARAAGRRPWRRRRSAALPAAGGRPDRSRLRAWIGPGVAVRPLL